MNMNMNMNMNMDMDMNMNMRVASSTAMLLIPFCRFFRCTCAAMSCWSSMDLGSHYFEKGSISWQAARDREFQEIERSMEHVIIGLDDGPDHMLLDYQERQAQAAQKQALSEISEDALRIAEDHFRPLRLLGNQLDQAPDDVDVVLFDVIHSLAI